MAEQQSFEEPLDLQPTSKLEAISPRHLTAVPDYIAKQTVGEQALKQSVILLQTYGQTENLVERNVWINQLSADELRLLICASPANTVLMEEVYPVAEAYCVLDSMAHAGLFRMCVEAPTQQYL